MSLICKYFCGYNAIPASSIVNKLNIMSYNCACTFRTITVAVVHSICSQSVRRAEGNAKQLRIVVNFS